MNRVDRKKRLEGMWLRVEFAPSAGNWTAIVIADDGLQFIGQRPITLTYREQD